MRNIDQTVRCWSAHAKRDFGRRGPPREALRSTHPKMRLGETRTPRQKPGEWNLLRSTPGGGVGQGSPHSPVETLDLDAPIGQAVRPAPDSLVEGVDMHSTIAMPALDLAK